MITFFLSTKQHVIIINIKYIIIEIKEKTKIINGNAIIPKLLKPSYIYFFYSIISLIEKLLKAFSFKYFINWFNLELS